MSWNAGYVTDVNYTFGYYADLSSFRTGFALTAAGLKAPIIRNACELGFGQGLSIVSHAATTPGVTWWGTDFNPAQAAFARDLAAASGVTAHLFDQAFEDFCARDDLPDFEHIALHGIWTWISDENRAIIVDFVRRKLVPGGTLYISYNTLPGWAAAAPLRHLMRQHGQTMAAPSVPASQRIDPAFAFMDQLFAINPAYTRVNTSVAERFAQLKTQNRQYQAHEYMNRDWRPMYVSEMAEWLEPAKLTYATANHLLDQQDSINMTPEQLALLNTITDVGFKETTRDFITGQQFRRDLWMRGVRRMTALEQAEAYRAQRFILVVPRGDIKMTMTAAQGEVTLHQSVYGPILDFLADNQIKTFIQIEVAAQAAGINLAQVANALAILVGNGQVGTVQDDKTIAKARPFTDKLNAALTNLARSGNDITYLASPVTGSSWPMGRFEQLFLASRAQGRKTPAEWAKSVLDILTSQGQQIIKDGQMLTTPEDNLAELTVQAQAFEKRLPILKGLGIA